MAGLYRRGKIYWARAQRAGREHRRSLRTTNRAIAEKRLAQWREDLDAIAWGDKPRRTFKEAAERFIREHLTVLKISSAERYGLSLRHLSRHFGAMTLDQIKSGTLSEFETTRRTQGVRAGTIRRDLACLSSLMASAIDWEWIEDAGNPVPGYMKRRARRGLREAPPRRRYLSLTEEAAMLDHANGDCRKAIALSIDTGLRREELLSLQWRQVDLVRGTITTTTNTKSGRLRKVPLPERSRTILGTLPRDLKSPFVLINPETGERYGRLNVGFKAAARRAKIDDIRWHDLRRTAGCRWLQRDGKSLAEVSLLLGHSSVTVTESRYAFLDADAVAESLSGRTETGTATPAQSKQAS